MNPKTSARPAIKFLGLDAIHHDFIREIHLPRLHHGARAQQVIVQAPGLEVSAAATEAGWVGRIDAGGRAAAVVAAERWRRPVLIVAPEQRCADGVPAVLFPAERGERADAGDVVAGIRDAGAGPCFLGARMGPRGPL